MGKLVASGFCELLDKFTPYAWMIRVGLIIAATIAIVLFFGSWQCSRQEAAQSKQDARSATAGTKTASEALTTLEGAQERDAGTDRIVIIGKEQIRDAQTDVEADAAARRSLCKLRTYARDDAACELYRVHP